MRTFVKLCWLHARHRRRGAMVVTATQRMTCWLNPVRHIMMHVKHHPPCVLVGISNILMIQLHARLRKCWLHLDV